MSDFRKRVVGPALIPLGAFLLIGALVYPMSRILLAVTKDGSVIVGILMAASILFAAGAVAKGGALKSVQRVGLIFFALLLLGGGIGVEASLGPREVEKHLEVEASIAAKNTAFDRKELLIPSGHPFLLEFSNNDSLSHNVAIYKDKNSLSDPAGEIFKGEVFPGPAKRDYEVKEPIPAGVYYFQCDVHPTMNGTARAGAATGGATPTATAAPSAPLPTATASPAPSVLSLIAKGLAFDKTQLDMPPNAQVSLDFDNQDASTLHNWAMYADAEFTQVIYRGPVVTSPAKTRYVFTAPDAGSYFFKCDIHPTMKGTVTVR